MNDLLLRRRALMMASSLMPLGALYYHGRYGRLVEDFSSYYITGAGDITQISITNTGDVLSAFKPTSVNFDIQPTNAVPFHSWSKVIVVAKSSRQLLQWRDEVTFGVRKSREAGAADTVNMAITTQLSNNDFRKFELNFNDAQLARIPYLRCTGSANVAPYSIEIKEWYLE